MVGVAASLLPVISGAWRLRRFSPGYDEAPRRLRGRLRGLMIAPGPHWCSAAAVRAVSPTLACSRCSRLPAVSRRWWSGSSAGAIAGSLTARYRLPRLSNEAWLSPGVTDIADPAFLQQTAVGPTLQNFISNVAVGEHDRTCLPSAAPWAPVGRKELVAFTRGNTGAAVRCLGSVTINVSASNDRQRRVRDGDMVSPVPIRIAPQLGATG